MAIDRFKQGVFSTLVQSTVEKLNTHDQGAANDQ